MAKTDYYELLDVVKNASDSDIKKSYRKLAMKYHPDRNPGDKAAEAKFKQIKEAYEILSDAEKRAAYDRFGHAGVNQGPPGSQGAGDFSGFADAFGDIFGDIFGGNARTSGGQRSGAFRGSDLKYSLEISLEDAANGLTTEIRVPTWQACKTCGSSGCKPGTKPEICKTCNGQGQVRMQQGFFSIQQTCPACRGVGKSIKNPCSACGGGGRVKQNKTLEVSIPAGIDNGMRIRSAGNGEPGQNGGAKGDLYVEVNVKEHHVFQRDNDDLHCEAPISFSQSALGGSIDVPTLNGRASFDIPEGTQTGKTFRLRGKGIKNVRSGVLGDLFCHVILETPVKLSDSQKNLLRDFDESININKDKHNPHSKNWMDKVKEFFT
ncbi:MAG: molecular chaperone DnaJ [Betaproteobacteria bacterium TMED156]|nr:MAG: molecular chaperone DnaJ [Betaproteobacteria bacterium TMED156]